MPVLHGYVWVKNGVLVDVNIRTRQEIIALIELDSVRGQLKLAA
jgi:hypothetical protein